MNMNSGDFVEVSERLACDWRAKTVTKSRFREPEVSESADFN